MKRRIERDSFRRQRRSMREHMIERFRHRDQRHRITPANDNGRSGRRSFR
jgi:hypothetical protein